jgi:hypothetical protein
MKYHALRADECGAYDYDSYIYRLPRLQQCTSENTKKSLPSSKRLVPSINCTWAACKTPISKGDTCKTECEEDSINSMTSGYTCGIKRINWISMEECTGDAKEIPGSCRWKPCSGWINQKCRAECTDEEFRNPSVVGKNCSIDPMRIY